MFFASQISTYQLVQLCHRVGNQLEAGVDERKIWLKEMQRAHGRRRVVMQDISESLERGNSLYQALKKTGNYFPEVFREMIGLGVETGHLDRILKEIADQYEHQLKLRRTFLAGIAWPMIQLVLAIFIIGGLIYAMGIISKITGTEIDILGFGLIGGSGLLIYFSVIGAFFAGGFFIYSLVKKGQLSFIPFGEMFLRIPGIGGAIKTLALSKMAWALALTTAGGMEVRKSMRLSLAVTRNRYFTKLTSKVDRELLEGGEIHEVLRATRSFPDEFLDAIESGETSGKLTEMMDKLSEQYQDKARAALNFLALVGGVVVWLGVMAIIVALIFKLAMFYIGTLNDALNF